MSTVYLMRPQGAGVLGRSTKSAFERVGVQILCLLKSAETINDGNKRESIRGVIK